MQLDALPERAAPGVAPLAYNQRSLWFIQQLVPEEPVYNMSRAWRVSGDLDVAALRRATALLVERHEPLRAHVRLVEGEPVQWTRSVIPDVLEYVDMRPQADSGEDRVVENCIISETRKIIDLENGPVFRARLLHLADGEFVFVMVMHHAFSDGWSISVLARDLGGYYNALILGQKPDLPELQTSYFEFARTQMLATDMSLSSDLDYWRQALADAPPLLDLPTDFVRPAMERFRGRRQVFEVGSDTLQTLKALARKQRVTLFMVLLAVFKVLLYRFSGQADVSVGTPFANRNASALENLVGLFVSTLVIRSQIEGGSAFDKLLTVVRGRMLEVFSHASIPLEQIVEHLRVHRDAGYNPLFQVMFVLQNTPPCALEMHALTTRDFRMADSDESASGIGVAKLDLSLTVTERDGTLKCALDYNTDLFLEETAESLGQSYVRLLEAVCATPDQRVDRLPLLDHARHRRILFDWNRTDEDLVEKGTVYERFSRQVERTADRVALIDSSGSVTYDELGQWSHRVATVIREHGARPGDVVAIAAAPTSDWIAALLGILQCGCIALPLDASFPKPRLEAFVEQVAARIILVPSNALILKMDLNVEVLGIPERLDHTELPDQYVQATAEGSDIAYIMFTSGSTGSPRAVAGTHRGILNRCDWMKRQYPYGDSETCCHHISPAFVDVFAEVLGPLLAGVSLSVIGHHARSDPVALISELERSDITRITLTPTMLRSMLETRTGVRGLKKLVLWISSGEPLDHELRRWFFDQRPDATLLNVYGSTEVAADATWFNCSHATITRKIPVGRPISNVKTYILGPEMQPLPWGFRGELHVGGAGVAKGYWQHDSATETRFLSDPFDGTQGRIYKTGDLARYRKDGSIEIMGRVDDQVKLHGVRIGVEEIESQLEMHEDVRSAVVGVWNRAQGHRFLVAWCVPEPGHIIDTGRLRRRLGHGLPRQWVPSYYVSVDSFPRLATGKIDRRGLPDPRADTAPATSGSRPPLDHVERKLLSIWQELLQCEIEDPDADFFDLGGHSLLVFQLLDRIESAFEVRLQVASVFLAPTIAELASRIRRLSTEDSPGVLIKIRDRGGTPLICVPAAATTVLSLAALGTRFDDDQSLFGVESYGLISGTEPQSSVVEMAQTYVDVLRRDQAHGPYCVAGRCFGGVVAFEMARQLSEAGENVALLALLETGVPLRNFDRVLAALPHPQRQRLESIHSRDRIRFRSAQADIDAEFERSLSAAPVGIQKMMRAVYSAHQEALMAYVPTPLDVPITVFRSRDGRWNERAGWDLFTRTDYRCQELEGDRDSLFEAPRVLDLSKALGEAMKRALART